MTPRLLAIDTATETLSLALASPAGERWLDQAGGKAASASLLPAVRQLLADAGCRLADLQAIAFGQGPGAFTGLRTACSVAQGLALGSGLPLLAIDSLLIVAEDARQQQGGDDWWVAMDARMDEVYAAAYHHDGQRWHTVVAPALFTLAALAQRWQAQPPQRVAGSAITAFAGRLPWGDAVTQPHEHQRAAALLRLAQQAWQHGPLLDAGDALPVYLRDKVAQTTDERRALREATGAKAVQP